MIKVDLSGFKKFEDNINKTILNFQAEVKASLPKMAEAVRFDIQRNVGNVESFDGSTIAPLKESTIKRKGFNVPLTETGKLGDSIVKQKVSDTEYRVFIKPERAQIGAILQKGKSPLAGARRFFGVSRRALENIERILNGIKIK